MLKWLRDLVDRVRESLFLIPAVVVVGFALLAWLLVRVDSNIGLPEAIPLLPTTVASARAILSTIAGATITVAAIVFSITALTVQLASSQYSLRIVGILFRDTFQQVVIGVVTGTFVFSLLVLSSVRLPDEGVGAATPSAAATLAIIMAVISMLAIIGFISHVLQRIRVDVLVHRIASDTTEEFRKLLPEKIGPVSGHGFSAADLSEAASISIRSSEAGWVVDIDDYEMLKAVEEDGVVRIDLEVGQFVHSGSTIATLWAPRNPNEAGERIRAGLTLARNRRIDGDPGFGLRILADIALKALSPGINDPATAVDVVSHLGEPLGEMLTREMPQRVTIGDHGGRAFRPHRPDREDYVRSALQEIRLNAAIHPNVIKAMIDLSDHLISLLEPGQERRADPLRTEIGILMDLAERSLPEEDYAPLRARAEKYTLALPSNND